MQSNNNIKTKRMLVKRWNNLQYKKHKVKNRYFFFKLIIRNLYIN